MSAKKCTCHMGASAKGHVQPCALAITTNPVDTHSLISWLRVGGTDRASNQLMAEAADQLERFLSRPAPEREPQCCYSGPCDYKHPAPHASETCDDLGAQIYALLVRRGYAQHEAHLIANGPGCTSDCVQKGYPEIDCPEHGDELKAGEKP